MIDGLKICNLPVNIAKLLHNDLLLFPLPINENTAEVLTTPRFADYRGLKFKIKNNNIQLFGSIHKYWNNGKHNYNDFYYSDLLNAIIDLCTKFDLNPYQTILNNVEFGVNIITPFAPEILLKSIINYKGTPFKSFDIKGSKGIECIKTDFYIKVYDKGHQYKRNENILRFEIKVVKMKFFAEKKIKINYLSDLLTFDLFYSLGTILKAVYNEILFYDNSINLKKLNSTERLILSDGCNSKFWEDLKPKSLNFTGENRKRDYENHRKKYYRELEKFKKISNKYSTSTIQKNTSELIEKKYTQLANYNENLRDKLTDFLNCYSNTKKGDKIPDFNNCYSNTKKGQNNILNIVEVCPVLEVVFKKECLVCKTDISHKKRTAKYCSKKCKNDYTNPLLNPKNNLKKQVEKINSNEKLFDDKKYFKLSTLELLKKPNSIFKTVTL